ncbi:type II toxin-antitoxin system RelE/ParE family toxin [Nioella aestuarii]|uniref:type II toxin-antitoxin system RelE/ParE family toxin n=1 Tax=Nioella aestuarii TaxID=1662864 RepID=UPI003D7F85D2
MASDIYRISRQADADLDEIWRYSADTWSPAQAERHYDQLLESFDRLAAFPLMGRLHALATPPVRIHPMRQHLVIYTEDAEGITNLRILGSAQDWSVILSALE